LRNRRLLVRGFFTGSLPFEKSKEFEIFLAPTAPKYLSGTFISIDLWGICDGLTGAVRRAAGRLPVTNAALAAPLGVPLNNQREKPAYEHILPR
jgi:hypothetical protein